MAIVYVCPFGALMTRLVLVTLFAGPMKEIPPGLNATGLGVGVDGVVAVGVTCVAEGVVADDVVGVVPVVDCDGLVEMPVHAVSNTIMASKVVQPSSPWKRRNGLFCIVLSMNLT